MCSDRLGWVVLAGLLLLSVGAPAGATVLVTVDEALHLAFPECEIERETVFLTKVETAAAGELSGESGTRALVVRHVARREGRLVGAAYFDVHRVRTLEETVLVVVRPDDTIGRVEVISFDEPMDYLPRGGWYRQFDGKDLGADLRLDRAIRSVSGATLTAVATTAAARRVLAVHQVIERRERTE
jgi:hypothetical protein